MVNLMDTGRLEAFSDGVIAVIITITVLGIRVPAGDTLASLKPLLPVFLTYVWSFQTVGTYWNNHHHLLHATRNISSRIMWANLHLLFWMSLIPFVTEWLGSHFWDTWPTAAYCFVFFCTSVAYALLEYFIVERQGTHSVLGRSLLKGYKERFSLLFSILSVIMAFLLPWVSYILIICVSVVWFIPDRRIIESS